MKRVITTTTAAAVVDPSILELVTEINNTKGFQVIGSCGGHVRCCSGLPLGVRYVDDSIPTSAELFVFNRSLVCSDSEPPFIHVYIPPKYNAFGAALANLPDELLVSIPTLSSSFLPRSRTFHYQYCGDGCYEQWWEESYSLRLPLHTRYHPPFRSFWQHFVACWKQHVNPRSHMLVPLSYPYASGCGKQRQHDTSTVWCNVCNPEPGPIIARSKHSRYQPMLHDLFMEPDRHGERRFKFIQSIENRKQKKKKNKKAKM